MALGCGGAEARERTGDRVSESDGLGRHRGGDSRRRAVLGRRQVAWWRGARVRAVRCPSSVYWQRLGMTGTRPGGLGRLLGRTGEAQVGLVGAG